MSWPILLLLAGSLFSGEAAGPPPPVVPALPTGAELDQGDPPLPGREVPVASAPKVALSFLWDGFRTVVVVDDGVGITRPAWVGTWDKTTGKLEVAYRAVCFRDARGRLHVDARRSLCVGPRAKTWSPDSFAFGLTRMWTIDDADRAHEAPGAEVIPASSRGEEYRTLLGQVQALVEGGS